MSSILCCDKSAHIFSSASICFISFICVSTDSSSIEKKNLYMADAPLTVKDAISIISDTRNPMTMVWRVRLFLNILLLYLKIT